MTGRELVEFFMGCGPVGGLIAMGVTIITFSIVIAISFEFARLTGSFDYRTFCRHLLGRAWILYELAYFAFVFVVLSVLGAASGVLIHENFALPELTGTVTLMAVIGLLVFYGNKAVESFFAFWSVLLYLTFSILVVICFIEFGDEILSNFKNADTGSGWFNAGISYAGYNVAGVPAMLFCIRHINTRKEALGAGLLCGPIAMIPGILLFVVMIGYYPGIMSEAVPTNLLMGVIDISLIKLLLILVMFGTFIETGAGLLHGVNERIAEVYREKGRRMPGLLRPTIAIAALVFSIYVASVIGIVDLIAQGYRYLTYAFIIAFVVPVLTLGLYRIVWSGNDRSAPLPAKSN